MGARAEAVSQTRAAIVTAARALHAERGLAATSWADIADRAGVSTATVYRHFPSLAELVPACAHTVFDMIKPPTLDQAGATFGSLTRASERFEQLVRYSCHCYEAGADWLHAAHRERDFVPELDAALGVIEGSLDVLVTAAAGTDLTPAEHGLLFVLCDFPIWRTLVARGMATSEVEEELVVLVHDQLERLGIDSDGSSHE